jgi:succinyl-CoA synthetase beta subunit
VLLFEHEGKSVLREFGIATPNGIVVTHGDQIDGTFGSLEGPYMIKAQVLTGGRGKAGGIISAPDAAAVREKAGQLLERDVKGQKVAAVLVEERASIAAERYMAMVLDGERMLCLIGDRGGVEVESFFGESRESFQAIEIDPLYGLSPYQVRRALEILSFDPKSWDLFADVALRLARLMRECDATLVEVNPLAELTDGTLLALDARIAIDDGALSRQPRFAVLERRRTGDTELSVRMKELEIIYAPVGGPIGMVNGGAGAGVAIMDWVALEGESVACFIDLDYTIIAGKTEEGLRFVLDMYDQDPAIKAIIVNFTTCGHRLDIITACLMRVIGRHDHVGRRKPIFFHLQGNRGDEADRMLREAGHRPCTSLGEAVRGAVQETRKVLA